MTATFRWGILIVLAALFAVLAVYVHNGAISSYDASIYDALHALSGEWTTRLFLWISELGTPLVMIGICVAFGLLFLLMGRKLAAFMLLISLLLSYGLNTLLKTMFGRERPVFEHLTDASGYSFPSGNAMISIAFYGMLAYGLSTVLFRRQPAIRLAVVIIVSLLILAIGVSRIYLGVHYASDIAAGYAAGGFCLLLMIMLARRSRG